MGKLGRTFKCIGRPAREIFYLPNIQAIGIASDVAGEAMKIGDFTGLVPKVELAEGEALQCIYGTFRNQGTATGFIGDFCISTNMGKFGPPLSPDSEESEPLFFGAVELKSDDIFSPTARLTWVALETVPKNYFRTLKVWGWVRYTDIHGIKRRSGFGFSYFRIVEADETPGVFAFVFPSTSQEVR